jgi:hypothetical protein
MFGYSAWLSLADGTKTNRQKVLSLPLCVRAHARTEASV